MFVFQGSLWTKDNVQAHWQRTNEVLRPCGIEVKVDLIETALPNGIQNLSAPNDQEVANILAANMARPVAFFGAGSSIQTFMDEFTPDSPRRSLIGTVWVGDVAESDAYKARVRPEYEVVAHEIGHLLGFDTHVAGQAGNLMSGEPGAGGAVVTSDQCRLFRTSSYLKATNQAGI